MAQQTVVQWISDNLIGNPYTEEDFAHNVSVFKQAKQMEKEQMHKCASFWRGKENEIEKPIFEQYYNETYKK